MNADAESFPSRQSGPARASPVAGDALQSPAIGAGAAEQVIRVTDLTYTYPGGSRPAISGVSFEVRRGEIFGLLGPSGAGKSTIQKVLTRQNRAVPPGRVHVLGRCITQWGQEFYERIGVGFELPNHYLRMTARENLRFFASLYARPTRDIDEALAMVGLTRGADVPVGQFSKGMMMRLNFVRATLHDPELLFLDEPTSGLDPVNGQRLKAIVRNLQAAGKTIVLTTHNMKDVEELCDRVGFMVAGEMRALETVRGLKAKYGRRIVVLESEDDGGVLDRSEFALDGLAQNQAFLQALAARRVKTLHSQEASLDTVFAEVTGARLDAED